MSGKTQRFHAWILENKLILKKIDFQRTNIAVEPLTLIFNSENWLETHCKILAQTGHLQPAGKIWKNHPNKHLSFWVFSESITSHIDLHASNRCFWKLQNPKPWIFGYLRSIVCSHINDHVSSCFICYTPEPTIMFWKDGLLPGKLIPTTMKNIHHFWWL